MNRLIEKVCNCIIQWKVFSFSLKIQANVYIRAYFSIVVHFLLSLNSDNDIFIVSILR